MEVMPLSMELEGVGGGGHAAGGGWRRWWWWSGLCVNVNNTAGGSAEHNTGKHYLRERTVIDLMMAIVIASPFLMR